MKLADLLSTLSELIPRICHEELNEVIAAFVQDKTAIERGLFDEEFVELTQVRMGIIVTTSNRKAPALTYSAAVLGTRRRPSIGCPPSHRDCRR
jgi:hypothetical protein